MNVQRGRRRCFLALLFSGRERRPAGLQWTIAIAPATPGRFDALLGDRLIAANTPSPFLSGVRALLAEGLAAPDDEVVLGLSRQSGAAVVARHGR